VSQVDEGARREAALRLAGFRARRDGAAVSAALDRLERTARGQANVVPPILDAVTAHATLGEIADALRRVFGQHHETFAI
jgi:methylmalonyl-CoA mutase N-terminal domain/subunit